MKNEPNKWIVPAEETGWELWKNGSMGPALEGEYETLPSSASQATFYVPVHTVATRVDSVFSADPDIEHSTAKMNLEVEFGDDENVDLYRAFEFGEKVFYTGVCVDGLEVEKSWMDYRYDFLPRLFRAQDEILLLREHGRWVMMCYLNGAMVHAQVVGNSHIQELVPSHLVALRMYLLNHGIDYQPNKVLVLSNGIDEMPGFECERVSKKSLMEHPEVALTFEPEQIRAWKKQKKAAKTKMLFAFVQLLLLIIGIGFLLVQRMKMQEEIAGYQDIVDHHQPMIDDNTSHIASWDELDMVVRDQSTIDLYIEALKAIPGAKLISLSKISVKPKSISFSGTAKNLGAANQFLTSLEKSESLSHLDWTTQKRRATDRSGFYTFTYEGKPKEVQP